MNATVNSTFIQECTLYDLETNLNQVINGYEQNGIIRLKNYADQEQIASLLKELEVIQHDAEQDIKHYWNDEPVCFYSKNPLKQEAENKEYVTQSYFQASADKAHIFYEVIDNLRVINRIGHGMHLIQKYLTIQNMVYQHPMLRAALKGVGFQKPICHLSVYIPKYPHGAGSEVRPHQESTFAYTKPASVVVLWLALEDAYIENACMYGILGSNRWPLKWVSRVDHQAKTREFELINNISIPDFTNERSCYTPLEVKAGDALLFHGNFVHCSPINHSNRSRKALSFQFIETLGTHYSTRNWLQPANRFYLY